ncbi:MAG: alpha/beta fold hydrolase [Planctomycetota bacterium]
MNVAVAAGYADSVWPFLAMLGLVAVVGLTATAIVFVWTARLMHRPPRLTPPRALGRLGRSSPADLGIAFEDWSCELPDVSDRASRLHTPAWWCPLPGPMACKRTVVLLHAYGDARSGALAWARLWLDAGFNVLLPDLRAHGEAGGDFTGAGVWEVDDVRALLAELKLSQPQLAETVVLAGISFGGMVAAEVARRDSNVAGVVVDSPITNWTDAAERFAELVGLPLPGLTSLRVRWMSRRLGVDLNQCNTASTLKDIAVPCLLILPEHDTLVPFADELAEAATGEVWRPATGHNLAIVDESDAYREHLEQFAAQIRATSTPTRPMTRGD